MNWINYIVSLKYLFLSNLVAITVWGQPVHQVIPKSTAPVPLSVVGTVLDATTGQPIPGAIVSIKNISGTTGDQQRAGQGGIYKLVLRSREAFVLSATMSGYEDFTEQNSATSVYTNIIENKKIGLYRLGTKPVNQTTVTASTTPVNQQAPVHTTRVSDPGVSLPEITARGTAIPPASSTNGSRVTPPKTLDAKVMYTPPPLVVAPGKTTQLKALQFVQSKAELLPEAQPALDQLLAFMNEHPTAEIELAGHTDNQGDFDENVRLSKQRVDLVKDYLVKNGIAANRITTRGFGPTRPIANNRNENTRQLNRRVEMTVLKQ